MEAQSSSGREALERLQKMLNVPPGSRPNDIISPLEKIEELLTCPICLDRYKNPKLLPCQHTFCMEPCLEGLLDQVRRSIKCPECRAEHSLPYDGAKAFQTNYSLLGFLEIHLQASEENAEELEAYIRRYNLERCKVCDEKAEVDYCFHCEKRVCIECKNTHIEMVKKDLARLMNQIKRLSNRITEASDGMTKGVDSLTLNCETAKEEVKDYVRRYMKDLKKKEDYLLGEIDTFYSAETRLMRNMRDTLELESSNINEACARVDACLKGEREANEEDLVRYKQLFVEGLDYLRSFHIDADDLFCKKIRFSVGQDANQLPAAIKNFGDLQVCVPQFGGRFQQLEASYVPRMFNLGLESDKKAKTRNYDLGDSSTWQHNNQNSNNDKRNHRKLDDDPTSVRYRRRQQLEEEAWNRLRSDRHTTDTRRSPNTRTSHASEDERHEHEMRHHVKKSPWAETQLLGENNNNSNNKHNQQKTPQLQTTNSDSSSPCASVSVSTRASPTPVTRAAASPIPVPQAAASANKEKEQDHVVAKKPPLSRQGSSSEDPALNDKIESIRREHEKRQKLIVPQTSTTKVAKTNAQMKAASKLSVRSKTEASSADEAECENRATEGGAATTVAVTHFPGNKDEESKNSEKREAAPFSRLSKYKRDTSPDEKANKPLDWKKYLIPNPSTIKTTPDNKKTEVDEVELSWLERRKRFIRSKTNPELLPSLSTARVSDSSQGAPGSGFRGRFLESLHNDQGRNTAEKRRRYERQDSSEAESESKQSDRRSRYRRKADKANSGSVTPATPEKETQENTGNRQEISLGTGENRLYRVFVNPTVDYVSKGRMLLKYGTKGSTNGMFNWPRGVTLIPDSNEVAICDSSNHRVQIFNYRGVFQRSFGKYGNGKGEFDCLAGIAANRFNQLIITDRYNHRVQVFETNGRFVREFGSHGQTNGRFHNPWGAVIDQQGFTYVCDKDNHRVQIFQADGNFVGKFGTIGSREGQFQNPHFIAVNRQNQLIVTDSSNHRVQVFDHNGHFLFAFGSEGFHEGQFKYPRGVAVDDQGFIVVADSGNNRIQIFHPDGRFYCAFGSWGSSDGQLKGVEGLALLADGRILVTDRENHRVQIF